MFIDFPKQNNIQHFKGQSPLKKNKRNKNKNKKGNKTRQKQKQKQKQTNYKPTWLTKMVIYTGEWLRHYNM